MTQPIIYLGTVRPHWVKETTPPLMISRRSMPTSRYPRARTRWVLDSGGFTELHLHGCWTVTPQQYLAEVRLYRDEIGMMDWAAPQDWMCEPFMLAKTGLTLAEHQRRTVDNLLELRSGGADLPIIPVLQGWTLDDYLRCRDLYDQAGIDLTKEPTVGVGSVCRRQATTEAASILAALHREGLRLHGFGLKQAALRSSWPSLVSSDSMAWSIHARLEVRRGATSCDPSRRKSCSNCRHYALEWLEATRACVGPVQMGLEL